MYRSFTHIKLAVLHVVGLSLALAACGPTTTAVPTAIPPTVPPTATSTNTPLPPTATITPTAPPQPTATPEVSAGRIVFVSNRGDNPNQQDLYLLDIESLEVTPLSTGLEAVVLPSWSPDGKAIAFSVAGVWNIYTVQADGSDLTQVTDFRSNNVDWSPDGSRLVFQSDHQNEPENTPDIYLIDANGENLEEILDEPPMVDYGPRWSPNGDLIMFVSFRSGQGELYVMKPDGSNIIQLTQSDAPVIDGAWSPDGSRIAYTSGQGSKTDIYVVDADGASNKVRLTDDNFADNSPSWSPDGKRIVFASKRSARWDLWVMNADGSDLTQLTDDDFSDVYPDWSP